MATWTVTNMKVAHTTGFSVFNFIFQDKGTGEQFNRSFTFYYEEMEPWVDEVGCARHVEQPHEVMEHMAKLMLAIFGTEYTFMDSVVGHTFEANCIYPAVDGGRFTVADLKKEEHLKHLILGNGFVVAYKVERWGLYPALPETSAANVVPFVRGAQNNG